VYFDPWNSDGTAFKVALMVFIEFPTTNAPSAAPPIISNSSGWYMAPRWPPASV
jgi:hypothetical protein